MIVVGSVMRLPDIPPPGDSGEVMRVFSWPDLSNSRAIKMVVIRRLSVTYLLPLCKLKHKHKPQ